MADFNVGLQAPQGQGVGVIAPVKPVGIGSMLEAGVDIAKALLHGSAEADKAKKEAQKQAILSEFSQMQSGLNDALMQGVSQDQVMASARVNFSKYIGKFPELSDEFIKINKGLFEHSALSDVKDRATMFQDQRRADIAAASSAGYTFNRDDPEQIINMKIDMYKKSRIADDEFKRIREQQSFMQSKSAEERAVWEHNNKVYADRYINEIGVSQLQLSQQEVDNVIGLVKSGKLTPQEGELRLAKQFTNVQSAIAAVTKGNTAMAEPWLRSFDNVQKYAVAALDPKAKLEDLENMKKSMIAEVQIQQMTSNPKLKNAAAVSGLFGHNVLGLIPSISSDVLQVVNNSQEGRPSSVLGTDVEKPTLDVLFKNIGDLKSGKLPQPDITKKGVESLSNTVLDNINSLAFKQGATYKDVEKVAGYFEKPEWAYAVSQGLVNKEANVKAKEVFQMIYQAPVSEGVLNRLMDSSGAIRTIDFQFAGAGIAFKPQNYRNLNYNEMLQQNAFFNTLKPAQDVLNKLIHIGAHMEGHTDYAKYWEENKSNLLPGVFYPKGTIKDVGGEKYEYVGPYPTNDQRSWRKINNADAVGN